MAENILLVVMSVGIFLIGIGIRNAYVYRFRMSLIEKVFANEEWVVRSHKLKEISYERMLFMFWKPLKPEAWWEDTSFLK